MTPQVAMLLVILLAMSVSFFTELLPISFTALMVPVLLQATGILTPEQAWAGFSNTTIITWYGLFIIGGSFHQDLFHEKDQNLRQSLCTRKFFARHTYRSDCLLRDRHHDQCWRHYCIVKSPAAGNLQGYRNGC